MDTAGNLISAGDCYDVLLPFFSPFFLVSSLSRSDGVGGPYKRHLTKGYLHSHRDTAAARLVKHRIVTAMRLLFLFSSLALSSSSPRSHAVMGVGALCKRHLAKGSFRSHRETAAVRWESTASSLRRGCSSSSSHASFFSFFLVSTSRTEVIVGAPCQRYLANAVRAGSARQLRCSW